MKHDRYTEKHVGVGMFQATCFAIPTVKVPAYFNDSQRQATKDAGTRVERRQSCKVSILARPMYLIPFSSDAVQGCRSR